LIAVGLVLPILFHAVGLGKVFLPMHIPVLLAGFFCGPATALVVGGLTPLLSALLTGMPPLMPPTAQIMVFELAAYALLVSVLFDRLGWGVYPSLIGAMVGGRLVYGLIGYLFLPLFGLQQVPLLYPLTYGVVTGLPGLVLQLAFVPAVVCLVRRDVRGLLMRQADGRTSGRAA